MRRLIKKNFIAKYKSKQYSNGEKFHFRPNPGKINDQFCLNPQKNFQKHVIAGFLENAERRTEELTGVTS